MLRESDAIIYPSRAQTADILAGLRRVLGFVPDGVPEFLGELEASCFEASLDFPILASHAANECNIWRDDNWADKWNAFGIGITGPGVVGVIFPSPAACARFAVAEYLLKLRRPLGAFADARQYAPAKFDRVKALVNGGDWPNVERISDLNTPFGDGDFVWMEDSRGPAAIVAKGNALLPNVKDQTGGSPTVPTDITFGKVPAPPMQIRDIPNSDNTAWNDLGKRTIRGFVLHRMLGSLWGTDGYFRGDGGSRALTDFGCGVAAQDGAENDGLLLRWNDPVGRRAPWANGALSAPYGDGLAFFNRYGVEAINRDLVSLEISGHQQTSLSEKSRNAIAGLMAYYADQYKVPWDTFPAVPNEDRSFCLYHEEITIGTGKRCPFDVVKAETASLIERTKLVLKKYQTSSTGPIPNPPTYAVPIIPEWLADDLEAGKPGDHQWTVEIDGKETMIEVFGCHRSYTAVKAANRLQLPWVKAEKVGPRLKIRETFMGQSQAKVSGRIFVLTAYGTWVDSGALTPRVAIRKA